MPKLQSARQFCQQSPARNFDYGLPTQFETHTAPANRILTRTGAWATATGRAAKFIPIKSAPSRARSHGDHGPEWRKCRIRNDATASKLGARIECSVRPVWYGSSASLGSVRYRPQRIRMGEEEQWKWAAWTQAGEAGWCRGEIKKIWAILGEKKVPG